MAPFTGILVAMVTPLADDQSISYDRTAKLLDKLLESDIEGVFILGTNGESYALNEDEKYDFAKYVINYVNGRTKVLVGTGLNGTAETVAFSKRIAALHPDALTLVAPSFVAPSQSELVDHFAAAIDAVDVPVLLYNMPGKTGINIDAASMKTLATHKNMVGIKDSSGNAENYKSYLDNRPDKPFSIIMGSDGRILESFQEGGDAAIASTANLLTENNVKLYKAFKAGDIAAAETYQANINPLREVLHMATTPVSIKACVTAAGTNVGPTRLPAQMPKPGSDLAKAVAKVVKDFQTQGII